MDVFNNEANRLTGELVVGTASEVASCSFSVEWGIYIRGIRNKGKYAQRTKRGYILIFYNKTGPDFN